jgi:hypothetical protein
MNEDARLIKISSTYINISTYNVYQVNLTVRRHFLAKKKEGKPSYGLSMLQVNHCKHPGKLHVVNAADAQNRANTNW